MAIRLRRISVCNASAALFLIFLMLTTSSCTQRGLEGKTLRFTAPNHIAVGPSGNVYVADTPYTIRNGEHVDGKDKIIKISPTGKLIDQLDPPGDKVMGMAVSRHDNIYVLMDRRQVLKLSSRGKLLKIVRTFWPRRVDALSNNEKPFPSDLAVDDVENIYVVYGTHEKNNKIINIKPNGRVIAQWTAHGNVVNPPDSANAIAIDKAGNIYVLEQSADFPKLEVFKSSGQRRWLRDVETRKLGRPIGLSVGGDNSLYFFGLESISRFTLKGKFIKSFGGRMLTKPKSWLPRGSWLSGLGAGRDNLYAINQIEGKVYKFSLNGKLLAVWGQDKQPPK